MTETSSDYKSNQTAEESAEHNKQTAMNLENVISDINRSIFNISEIVRLVSPGELMQRAFWIYDPRHSKRSNEVPIGLNDLPALRMVDYIQSIIASVAPAEKHAGTITDEAWGKLYGEVDNLFSSLMMRFQICRTFDRQANGPNFASYSDDLQVQTELSWICSRGLRYHQHEKQALSEVINPHSDILLSLFGIDACTIADEFEKIIHKLTFGIRDASKELYELNEELKEKSQGYDLGNYSDIYKLIDAIKSPDLTTKIEKVSGEVFGLDIFDVEKITKLPRVFLDELSWAPGEDQDFFAGEDDCGWPLKVWPIMKRPFLKLDNRIYCFSSSMLFDNFYRVIENIISRMAPEYKKDKKDEKEKTWNKRQKKVTEELSLKYLEKILPGSKIIPSVYYRWKPNGKKAEWYECDGLIIYDDYLFVIEVKAGSFTRSSPTTDLNAHIESLTNLLQKPALQGERFIKYLESNTEVTIADSSHNEIDRLRKASFRHIVVCAITLDSFTSLAAHAQHLQNIGLNIGGGNVWPISIDDLRVYADLFANPLVFLHYVKNRMDAAHSQKIYLHDELDHLGLYYQLNDYTKAFKERFSNNVSYVHSLGVCIPIDNYYSALLLGEDAVVPEQKIPMRLKEILKLLAETKKPNRTQISNKLLDLRFESREKIARKIDGLLERSKCTDHLLSARLLGEQEFSLMVDCPDSPCSMVQATKHAMTIAVGRELDHYFVLLLKYSGHGILLDVDWQTVSPSSLDTSQLDYYREKYEAHRSHMVALASTKQKIKRNDPCPCCSGKKYKHCCQP